MISYWGVDHGGEVSKAFGGGMSGFKAGAAYMKGQAKNTKAYGAARQGMNQVGAAGAYSVGKFKAAPMKKKVGYGAGGALGASATGYGAHKYNNRERF